MSLSDMEAQGELQPLGSTPEELASLLRMAARRVSDAQVEATSPESRVVHAYQAVLACAKAALRAQDYRVPNGDRQHYLTLETLRFTLQLTGAQINFCQTLRRKRHRDEYEGTLEASPTEAAEAAGFAAELLAKTHSALQIEPS